MTQAVAGVIVREDVGVGRNDADTGNDVIVSSGSSDDNIGSNDNNVSNGIEMDSPASPASPRWQQQLPNDDDDIGLIGAAAPAPLPVKDRMSTPYNLRLGGLVW